LHLRLNLLLKWKHWRVTKALVTLLACIKNQELDEGAPQAPDLAFPGKTVSKALPPSLFAELSQQERCTLVTNVSASLRQLRARKSNTYASIG
jgi:hypothetical protein